MTETRAGDKPTAWEEVRTRTTSTRVDTARASPRLHDAGYARSPLACRHHSISRFHTCPLPTRSQASALRAAAVTFEARWKSEPPIGADGLPDEAASLVTAAVTVADGYDDPSAADALEAVI